jgi:hypothetical protein
METHFVKKIYVILFVASGKLMVNVVQQQYLQTQKQKKRAVFLQPLNGRTVV